MKVSKSTFLFRLQSRGNQFKANAYKRETRIKPFFSTKTSLRNSEQPLETAANRFGASFICIGFAVWEIPIPT